MAHCIFMLSTLYNRIMFLIVFKTIQLLKMWLPTRNFIGTFKTWKTLIFCINFNLQ